MPCSFIQKCTRVTFAYAVCSEKEDIHFTEFVFAEILSVRLGLGKK